MNKSIIILALVAVFVAVASATVGHRGYYHAYSYPSYSYGASYGPYRGFSVQGGVVPAYSAYQPYYQPYYGGYYGPGYYPYYSRA